jgi:ribosomal protein L14
VRPAQVDRPAACEPGWGRRKPGTLVVFAPWSCSLIQPAWDEVVGVRITAFVHLTARRTQ